MKPQWGGNRGRGRGSRSRGRVWRGNSFDPRGGGPLHPMHRDYQCGPPMMRGYHGGFRGRPPLDVFNQQYPPHCNEPPWVRLRDRPPYGPGMLMDYPNGLHHRRPFLSPPRAESPVRPSSPLPGSEEYMQRDISEKSAFLKRQLKLEPPPPILNTMFSSDNFRQNNSDFVSDGSTENFCDNPYLQNSNLMMQPSINVQNKCDLQTPSEKVSSFNRNKRLPRRQKKPEVLDVEEIYDKIINHISNLSHGKKVNLVNQAGPSGYDIAVQQITRQKRLELSKALRDMCNNKFKETESSSDVINAIIPDFDIKIEELPREVVEQLSSTLDENVEERIQTMCIDPEVMFQQAADMLNNMLDVESEVKNDVNLADCGSQLQDDFGNYSGFQNVVETGDLILENKLQQSIGDSSTNFVPNDTNMQSGCTDLPFDEPMASGFHNDSTSCRSSSVDFSVPPPMNFSVPPPVNFGIPPPTICDQPNNELLPFTDYPNPQQDNNLNDDNYNIAPTQIEECLLYPEANPDETQYYSPGHPSSDDNSLQATPVFNDLMMGQDLLNDNNIVQAELSLPINVNDGGILLPTNPCDKPPFNIMEGQESEQYFDLNTGVDDEILMTPNDQPPENLTEQIGFVPNVDEVNKIVLPSETLPIKNVKQGKAIILSDIRIPQFISQPPVKESDVLTEAAELEACLAQGEAELKTMDTNKSKKISFTFNKTNNFVRSKIMEDEGDHDVLEPKNSSKKQSPKKPETDEPQIKVPEEPIKIYEIKLESNIKKENKVESNIKKEDKEESNIKKEDEEKQPPIIECEEKQPPIIIKCAEKVKPIKLDNPKPEEKKPIQEDIFQDVPEQPVSKKIVDKKDSKEPPKEEKKNLNKKKLPTKKPTNTVENIKEKEKSPEIPVIPVEPSTSMETEPPEKTKEKPNKRSKNLKSKSKSIEQEIVPAKVKNKKVSRKSNKTKQKSFEEEEFLDTKKKDKKSKSSEIEEFSKSDSYKSKFERSRYDIFYSQKIEDGYKKKYKEKGREMVDEERHRRSDSDRSFEKYREKFRSSDSEHSEHRYSKYHQEREDMRHSKRYYHDCYPPYRTDYVDYKNDYYGSQKYPYASEYYSKQESSYTPEDFEPKTSHHTQKHRTKYEKTHKKRSKKHKKQREKSTTSLSSISSEERDSSTSSQSKKTKHKPKGPDPPEERSTTKGHKIPLKDRIQMLYESKFERKCESSVSDDYDEDRKIKSEPVSPEVSRKPSPERSRSVEKVRSKREPMVISASDLREALNKKALTKAGDENVSKGLLTKLTHPGTPVVPFTNKPCPARKQVEDPQREREEMIMNRDSMISFRNKPCPLNKKQRMEEELKKERELQLAKELPDIDNIAKIISNLSTIVKPTKVVTSESPKSNPTNSVKIIEGNEKILDNVEELQKSEPKKFVQRPWKSPGEKKFMMEHLQRNPAYGEELDYESVKKPQSMEVKFPDECCAYKENSIADKFVVIQEEKLAFLNPEPSTEEISENIMDTDVLQEKTELVVPEIKSTSSVLKIVNEEEKEKPPKIQELPNISLIKPKTEKIVLKLLHDSTTKQTKVKEVSHHQNKPKTVPKIQETEQINSTSEKIIKSGLKPEKLKEIISKPLESPKTSNVPNKSTKIVSTNTTKPSAESTQTKDSNKTKLSRNRSKSRSRSKTKERELLHSAEVSSTSDTAAKSNLKLSIESRSSSKSKTRNSTSQPPKEEEKNFKKETSGKLNEQPIDKTTDMGVTNPEDSLIAQKMLITTYTQTQTGGDDKKDSHKSRKSSRRDKSHSTSSSHKSRSRPNVSTQTSIHNTNSYTQTPSARCKSVQVQCEFEEEKSVPKKAIFVQTEPIVIFDSYNDADDFEDKLKYADKNKRKILKAVRRRRAVERMFDLDKEIERLTKLRQSLYKKLNFDSESSGEDETSKRDTKISKVEMNKSKNRKPTKDNKKKPVSIQKPKQQKRKMEKQNVEEQFKVNVANLRTYKKTPSLDLKKDVQRNFLLNKEAILEGITKKLEKVIPTSIESKTETSNERPKVAKTDKSMEKTKINEQKHDLNKNLPDLTVSNEKQKENYQQTVSEQNTVKEVTKTLSSTEENNEILRPSEIIIETPQTEEEEEISPQIIIIDPEVPEQNEILPDLNPTNRENDEREKAVSSDTNESEVTPLNITQPEIQPPESNEQTLLEKPNLPNEDHPNVTALNQPPMEENIPDIKTERRTPVIDDQQEEKTDAANSEIEDSIRSTRSRQRKSKGFLEETVVSKTTDSRKKQNTNVEEINQPELDQPKINPKRRYRRKTESENKMDTSFERNTNDDEEENVQSKSKKRSRETKSPRRSKENKNIIKIKFPTSNEQKKKFQDNLKETKAVRSPSKRRKRIARELFSSEEYQDELSKTIDEVARNETGTQNDANFEITTIKLRRREKTKDDIGDIKNKLKKPKRVLKISEFDEETTSSTDGRMSDLSRTQSDPQENPDYSSDSVAFRGFKNDQLYQTANTNTFSEQLHVTSEESFDSSNKTHENSETKPPKQKKRKKADIIELDPEIDSQNLLQIQMVKKPKNDFDPYTENTTGTYKKHRKRYPFSGVKLNYRTKKRKSSSDAHVKSSPSLKKAAEDKKTKSSDKINQSIVRITRYSLSELEEMRNSIREKKEDIPTNNSTEETSSKKTQEERQPRIESLSVEKEPTDAYNLKILSFESLDFNIQPQESKPHIMPVIDACEVIQEEIHLKEEIPSVHSLDFIPENESCSSVNSTLHLETSNMAFKEFVQESLHDYSDCEIPSEPPLLTPEVDIVTDSKTSDCECLEVVDEDSDHKMDFQGFTGAILVIKVIASTAIAASDKGKVFCFSMLNGNLIDTFEMSKLAITSLIVIKRNDTNLVYTGSLDSTVGVLNFNTKEVLKQEKLPEPVQCMEYAWNYIFIGSDRGSLIRYDLNTNKVEDAIKITDYNVLVIKATQEGPRKVLVVATRNAPVSIRDARSGLLLRTMQTPFSPTVYTLLFEKNLIYCGTSQHDILVYTFEDGQLIFKHEATKSKGVVCMQIVGNLLFAGCYNGNIYVYNTKTNIHLGTMNGPGGLMLSMEIVRNKIIVGTKSSNFRAWKIPQKYLDQM